eukprot:Nk52_evm44s210 gene=Nk52_evmTU44s210
MAHAGMGQRDCCGNEAEAPPPSEGCVCVATCGMFQMNPRPCNEKYPIGDRLFDLDTLNLKRVASQFLRDELCTIKIELEEEGGQGKARKRTKVGLGNCVKSGVHANARTGQWSLVNVLSPYSNLVHLMVVETSSYRYLPAPETVSVQEGGEVLGLVKATIREMYRFDFAWEDRPNASLNARTVGDEEGVDGPVYFGYNWAPRAFNGDNEMSGYQSVKTKLHFMIWRWPMLKSLLGTPEKGCGDEERVRRIRDKYGCSIENEDPSVSKAHLAPHLCTDENRVFYEHVRNIVWLAVKDSRIYGEYFVNDKSKKDCVELDGNGICMRFSKPLIEGILLNEREFFEDFLLPISTALNNCMKVITESITDMDFDRFDSCMKETETGTMSTGSIDYIGRFPSVRSKDEARKLFKKNGLSDDDLLDFSYNIVKNRKDFEAWKASTKSRANASATPPGWPSWALKWENKWLKGFGYGIAIRDAFKEQGKSLGNAPDAYNYKLITETLLIILQLSTATNFLIAQ